MSISEGSRSRKEARHHGVAQFGEIACNRWGVSGASGDLPDPVPGADSILYQTPPVTSATSYWVRVENACGSEDSLTATITVASGPVITSIKSKTSKPRGSATIYGSGFSTNAQSNAVYFGSWKAKISKAKSTSLKVKIPKKVPKGISGVHVVVGGKTGNTVPFVVK